MGCKAITPHLVSLAKRLEGKPFHLLAAHNQRDTKENVLGYLKTQDYDPQLPNMTVTSFGGHPKVKGNGYVPYYMVFDQHGELVRHHMCGPYHGGDGLKMIEVVDGLLAATPEIYLGKEPFEHAGKLAKEIGKKKRLGANYAAIEKELKEKDLKVGFAKELERLKAAIADYQARMLKVAQDNWAKNPSEVIPVLQDLAKDLKGSALADEVNTKLKEARDSRVLRDSIKVWTSYEKTLKRLAKMDDPSPKRLEKIAAKLEKLIEGKDELSVTAQIRAKIKELRGG